MRKIPKWSEAKTPQIEKAIFALTTGFLLFAICAIWGGDPSTCLTAASADNQSSVETANLPERFDVRELASLTPVKEQGATGGCWAFASIAALESHLAFQKKMTFNLSENNLMTQLSQTYDESFKRDSDSGGDDLMAAGYYAAWRGPVLEKNDPFPDSKMGKDMIMKTGVSPALYVQEILFLPERKNPLDNDRIKKAILAHGAVSAAMWKGSRETFGPYYNEDAFSWYYDQPFANKEGQGHAVTIVGWYDAFPKSNFKITPPGDGAFIVRNTKGPLWGQPQRKKNLGGYFYISYYDRMFMTKLDSLVGNHVFSRVDQKSQYDRIYQHDLLGYNFPLPSSGGASSPNAASFANVFTAASRHGEMLKAASFYALSEGVRYEISVVANFTGHETLSEGILVAKGALDLPGYYTIDFSESVRLAPNSRFAIVVKQTAALSPAIASDSAEGHDVKRSVSHPEESYVWDGKWTDLYSTHPNTNVCLKAFTSNLPAPPDKTFSIEDMKKDLEFALNRFRTFHPITRVKGFSASQSAVIDSVRQKIASPLPREEFFLQMLRIFAMMGDGHTILHGKTDEVRYLDLPVHWLVNDGIVVAGNAGPLRRGDRIVSLGGADENRLLNLFGSIIPHENQHWIRANAPGMFRFESHLSFLGLVNPDSTIDTEVVRSGATRIYRLPLTQSATDIPQLYTPMDWRIEKGNNLGYFRFDKFPSLEQKEELAVEIDKFFAATIKERVSNVAFDWRYNGGGNLPILTDILSYVKACPMFVPGNGRPIIKKPKDRLFDGKLYIMVSNRTFSSAVVSSTVLNDNKLAITLGEPTGETPDFNRHGSGGDGDLPASRWHFMMVTVRSDRPRPNYSETFVKLDFPVFTSGADLIAGRDIQLEKLREITAGRNWRYASTSVDFAEQTDSLAVDRGPNFLFDPAKKMIVIDRDPNSIKRAYFIDTAANLETQETTFENGKIKIPSTLKPGSAYHLVFEFASSQIAFLSSVLAQNEQTLDLLPLYVKSFSYNDRFQYFIITFKEPIKKLNPEGITVADQKGRPVKIARNSVAEAAAATLIIKPAEQVTAGNPCIITLEPHTFVLQSGITNSSQLHLGNYKFWK